MRGEASRRTRGHSIEWRFAFPVLVTGLPANHGRWYLPPYRSQALQPVSLFWGALAGRRFFVGSPESSSSRYITGALLIAIAVPFLVLRVFNDLRDRTGLGGLDSRSRRGVEILKIVEVPARNPRWDRRKLDYPTPD